MSNHINDNSENENLEDAGSTEVVGCMKFKVIKNDEPDVILNNNDRGCIMNKNFDDIMNDSIQNINKSVINYISTDSNKFYEDAVKFNNSIKDTIFKNKELLKIIFDSFKNNRNGGMFSITNVNNIEKCLINFKFRKKVEIDIRFGIILEIEIIPNKDNNHCKYTIEMSLDYNKEKSISVLDCKDYFDGNIFSSKHGSITYDEFKLMVYTLSKTDKLGVD